MGLRVTPAPKSGVLVGHRLLFELASGRNLQHVLGTTCCIVGSGDAYKQPISRSFPVDKRVGWTLGILVLFLSAQAIRRVVGQGAHWLSSGLLWFSGILFGFLVGSILIMRSLRATPSSASSQGIE